MEGACGLRLTPFCPHRAHGGGGLSYEKARRGPVSSWRAWTSLGYDTTMDKPKATDGWGRAPRLVQAHLAKLTGSETKTYLALCSHVNGKTGVARVRRCVLSEMAGITERTVTRALTRLADLGLIETFVCPGRTPIYELSVGATPVSPLDTSVAPGRHPDVQGGRHPDVHPLLKELTELNNTASVRSRAARRTGRPKGRPTAAEHQDRNGYRSAPPVDATRELLAGYEADRATADADARSTAAILAALTPQELALCRRRVEDGPGGVFASNAAEPILEGLVAVAAIELGYANGSTMADTQNGQLAEPDGAADAGDSPGLGVGEHGPGVIGRVG